MKTLSFTALAALVLGSILTTTSHAATVLYFSAGTSGTGQQSVYAPTTPIAGTMTTSVPLFNPALGTLIQADYELAGNTNGAWQAVSGTGTIDFNLTGPADVGGQSMGTLSSGFNSQPIVDFTPIPYGTFGFVNSTYTSGAFFNTLTGVGNIALTWQYSGSTAISTPAVGAFDWGGSAHVLYTYIEVPEPGICTGASLIALAALLRRRST